MIEFNDLQSRILMAACGARGCVTVVVSADGETAVSAGCGRICESTAPLDSLVAARLVRLIGSYEEETATLLAGGVRGVSLYELTLAGRYLASALGSTRR